MQIFDVPASPKMLNKLLQMFDQYRLNRYNLHLRSYV